MVVKQEHALETRPLTAEQRKRLLIECVPFVGTLLIAPFLFPNAERGSAIWLVLLIPLLLFGYEALKALIDLFNGAALVEQDRLIHLATVRRRMFFGEFERLGRLNLRRGVYDLAERDRVYRVVYSPKSKLVWELGPVD